MTPTLHARARNPGDGPDDRAVQGPEDRALVTGRGRYTDDIGADGAAHLVFVRSTMAHAELRAVDTTAAAAMVGVVGTVTAEGATTADAPSAVQDWAIHDVRAVLDLPATFDRPPLARGRVRFVGDIVAAVIAETREQAVDAAEAVEISYQPLPAVIDPEWAATSEAPVIWNGHGSNVCFETSYGTDGPDPFHDAEVVVRARTVSQRLAAVPLEPDAALAVPGPGYTLTLYVPSQNPHAVRDSAAAALDLDPERLRVVAPRVGGAFGPKADLHVEYVIVATAARRLGRPVRWTQTRSENLVAMSHGRAMVMDASLALRRDGTMVGLSAEIIADSGAYPAMGAVLPVETQLMSQGPYDLQRLRFRARSVTTNTTPTGPYRGVARAEATQMLERLVDAAAVELRIDPVELRHRNLLAADRFPFTTVTGAHYDSGDYRRALDLATTTIDYPGLRAQQARRRADPDSGAGLLGIGVALYVYSAAGTEAHQELGEVAIGTDGHVTVTVGTADQGQGHEATFTAIVAGILGVDEDQVQVLEGDTGVVPEGLGTFGSRSLQTGGSAIHDAAHAVWRKARTVAAHLLEAAEDDLVPSPGGFEVVGVPASAISWAALAQAAADPDRLPPGMSPGLSHQHLFDGQGASYPFGAHIAVVEIDRHTGAVQLLRHVAVDDCGTVIDPVAVTGQQQGGTAQGVSQALHEWVRYDEQGTPLTATLLDYVVPSAADLPAFETGNTETPAPRNPLGAKGIGESGAIGATPAVHNAVIDALSHLGIRHLDMPCTPQQIWEAISGSERRTTGGHR